MISHTLRHALLAVLVLTPIAGCGPPATPEDPQQVETWIVNVQIIDGTGGPSRPGSVQLLGDRIGEIRTEGSGGGTVIDGNGLVLAPGFIDTHTHHDARLLEFPDAFAAVSQGITTIVAGQDGGSGFPLAKALAEFEASPSAVNVASYSGHNTIRRQVMGEDYERQATDDEIQQMAVLLQADLDAGALGLSTGLEYDPGIYSSADEVIELARVAAGAGGRYISHMRSEDRDLLAALDELINIGRQTGIPVQISHFKLAAKSLWGRAPEILESLDRARAEGIEVTADVYPYEYWQSTMTVLFPERVFDRASAQFALDELAPAEGIRFSAFQPDPSLVGRTLAEVAAERKEDPVTTYLDLIQQAQSFESQGGGPVESIIGTSMATEDIEAILKWPHANICTDGGLKDRHPRGIGSYPRILGRFVRERDVIPLELAIHKATALAARHVGLTDRGVLEARRASRSRPAGSSTGHRSRHSTRPFGPVGRHPQSMGRRRNRLRRGCVHRKSPGAGASPQKPLRYGDGKTMNQSAPTSWDHASVRIKDDTAHVTYDRSKQANSLSETAVHELREAIESTANNPEIRLVILRTAGDRAFCAGADVTIMRGLDAVSGERFIRSLHGVCNAVRRHPAPVLAVVQGTCLGAGLELMISCDFAIASDRAAFGMPEPFVGMPSVIEAALLPQIIGLMRTRDLLLTGDNISAKDALDMGMLTRVVPHAELEDAVAAKQAQVVRHDPIALRLQKELMNRWLNLPMDEAVEAGVKAFAVAMATGAPARAIESYWAERGSKGD